MRTGKGERAHPAVEALSGSWSGLLGSATATSQPALRQRESKREADHAPAGNRDVGSDGSVPCRLDQSAVSCNTTASSYDPRAEKLKRPSPNEP